MAAVYNNKGLEILPDIPGYVMLLECKNNKLKELPNLPIST